MNRRAFLRGAAALPVAAVVPKAASLQDFELVMGPAPIGPFRFVTLYEDQRALIGHWEFGSDMTLRPVASDPSVAVGRRHLPIGDDGEETLELDADATTERNATIGADATPAGDVAPVQSPVVVRDTLSCLLPGRGAVTSALAGEVSAACADGGVGSLRPVASDPSVADYSDTSPASPGRRG